MNQVSKVYPNTTVPAVDSISLTIPAGSICVLVGPSGCGKTTVLRMINRLVEPTAGEIMVNGESIMDTDPDQLRRKIGYVIQQIGLLPHRTISQNVAIVPRLLKWSEERIEERVLRLLELVGLDYSEVSEKYPYQLSGGQMQRVGVARALAADPPIMLMDEPFGAVDPIVRGKLQDEFLKLQQKVKKTICFITHDMNEAVKMGDYLVIMKAGKLVQQGTPLNVLSEPADAFVAELIGEDRGLKLLDLTKVEALMTADIAVDNRYCGEDLIDKGLTVEAYQPVKLALEVMMKQNTDVICVCRGGEPAGILSWNDIKKHISRINGDSR